MMAPWSPASVRTHSLEVKHAGRNLGSDCGAAADG